MTPGDYLYQQRKAAAFSRQDVALRIDTDPPISCTAREQLLVSLEAGLIPMRFSDALVLATIEELRLNISLLAELIDAPTVVPIRPLLVSIGGKARS